MSLYDHPELYDELLPADAECVAFYAELARALGGPVLELACGTGQLTGDAFGLDREVVMVHHARRRRLFVADMREFALRRPFRLIFVARNSLLHLTSTDEIVRCLTNVRSHLEDDGVFAFDVFNPSVAMLARRGRFFVMRRRDLVVEETPDYDAATQVNRTTWHVAANGEEIGAFALHLRSIFPQELPLLLEQCGFRMAERFGDYDRSPFESNSPRQVVLCRAIMT